MAEEDPYALHADGTAVDPSAFRKAALADEALADDLRKDERASRVLASGDDAALQELLKEVHQVRVFVFFCVHGRRLLPASKQRSGGARAAAAAIRERERERETEKSNCR